MCCLEKKFFILGGNDAEMEAIKSFLGFLGTKFIQPKKEWGEHEFSSKEIISLLDDKEIIEKNSTEWYFVECVPDQSLIDLIKKKEGAILMVDHHGKNSADPPSLIQILRLFEGREMESDQGGMYKLFYPPLKISQATKRWFELVAANDCGYIPAMLVLGATAEEIERVRSLERSAQGITLEQENEAERAIAHAETADRLTVVRMAHSKTATVCDRMFGRYDQLIILSGDGEVNFFGDGAICAELKEKFQGWSGGSGLGKKGESAYWGGYPDFDEVLNFVKDRA